MAEGIKICTIGGGSSYTPELMNGFIKRYDRLPIREIWLVDVERGREKLEIVGALAQRMWEKAGLPVKVHLTLDRREALRDADFVTTQFRVGLLEARIKDERIPFSYGMLGQETNGAGGMFKALRTIPVILDIVEEMKELCPNAWLVNFTNPSGMVTESVIRYGGWNRCVGLCNVPIGAMLHEPELIGKTLDELVFRFAGIDHFHWHRVFDAATGAEVTDQIIEKMLDPKTENDGTPANIHDIPFYREQLGHLGMIPCGYHRYYYLQSDMLADGLREYADPQKGSRAEQVKAVEDELFELYRDPDLAEMPELLSKRGGAHYSDVATETVASIYGNANEHIVCSTVNNGAIPDLPADAVVQVSSYIGGAGAQPIAFGPMPTSARGYLQLMWNMQRLVEEAAVTGDYGALLEAVALNPQTPSGDAAKRVIDELLVAHAPYLPQFAEKIAELKAAGVTIKDPVVADLCARGL
ncbi:MAG: 6-phospho-beta-glucosidase [Atopobiaceae bacterium]|nr:6-phospho-beta-glucosidase [Atopobiaceae bacterium]MBR3314720.1 6-phospho-beta-glucosidase [Atopobiaceae bacterium]